MAILVHCWSEVGRDALGRVEPGKVRDRSNRSKPGAVPGETMKKQLKYEGRKSRADLKKPITCHAGVH
jgi:hypothetical protein